MDARRFFLITLAYLVFVVYGSLVPLDYQPFSLDQALIKFQSIPYLDLGIDSRADWIANILLYVPLSFLILACFYSKSISYSRFVIPLFVFIFCSATAVVVEFVQQFFPPRTVSLNDLIAEVSGTVIGIVFWFSFGNQFRNHFRQISFKNSLSVNSSIYIFVASYVFLSLFPFDFVTSIHELSNKLNLGHDGFFINLEVCRESVFRCAIKYVVEILSVVPLGALFAKLPFTKNRNILAIGVGFMLGLIIELAQVFIYSNSGQGVSVITRMIGMAIGVHGFEFIQRNSNIFRLWLNKTIWLILLLYLLVLIAINGWLDQSWGGVDDAWRKLNETQFLPFYYFYYTSETIAVTSLLSNIASYIPVGGFFWLFVFQNPDRQKFSNFFVGVIAGFLSVIIETGKLFLDSKHADPTDILIAFAAGAGAYALLMHIQKQRSQAQDARDYIQSEKDYIELYSTKSYLPKKWIIFSGLFGVAVFFLILRYPIQPTLLAIIIMIYCYFLFKKTYFGFFVLPVLLPNLDLTPWTGRFFLDEFDIVVLATLMVMCSRPNLKFEYFHKKDLIFVGIFLLMLGISAIIGLTPFATMDANAFSNYYSHYNALRCLKGFLWAVLLGPFFISALHTKLGRAYFLAGLLLGLAGVAIFSVLERWVFPGIFDFANDYRINGMFSSMHTGGGHFESFLVLVMPFIVVLFFEEYHSIFLRPLGWVLFIFSFYALLMTFSRGGLIGLSISFFTLLIGLYIHFQNRNTFNFKNSFKYVLSTLICISFLVIPVFKGDLMKSRINVVNKDSEIRFKHWIAAYEAMDDNLFTQLFGMGLGSFPRTYFWLNQDNAHPSTYRIGAEADNQYLALQSGDGLFIGQYIKALPHQQLKLSLDIRGMESNTKLYVPICEKSLQYSFRCVSTEFKVTSTEWQRMQAVIEMDQVGAYSADIANGWLTRPIQFALYAVGEDYKVIEVDNLSLIDENNRNLLNNGDFSNGSDYWYFATDQHKPWHIFNIWFHVLFDMGWLGLVSFILLLVYVYYRLVNSLQHDEYAPILLASFTGFLIVGFVDSPFDAPRLAFLFSMLVIFAIFGTKRLQKPLRVFN